MQLRRWSLGLVGASTAIGGILLPTGPASATTASRPIVSNGVSHHSPASCTPYNVVTFRGEGHWTKCSSGGYTIVDGWVRDNLRDGLCAQVYANWSSGWYAWQTANGVAVGAKFFRWRHPGSATVIFRIIPPGRYGCT